MNCACIDRPSRWLTADFAAPGEVKNRLDTMIEKRFQILVGDTEATDKAVHRCLAGGAGVLSAAKSSVSQHEIRRAREHEPVLLGL